MNCVAFLFICFINLFFCLTNDVPCHQWIFTSLELKHFNSMENLILHSYAKTKSNNPNKSFYNNSKKKYRLSAQYLQKFHSYLIISFQMITTKMYFSQSSSILNSIKPIIYKNSYFLFSITKAIARHS